MASLTRAEVKRLCVRLVGHDASDVDMPLFRNAAQALRELLGRVEAAEARVAKALDIAVTCGGHTGEHHKAFAIDQIVRALTGCPVETRTARDCHGETYEYQAQGASEEYAKFVADACDGGDGPETYTWDEGVAPRGTRRSGRDSR
jgi:hypothetical protein